MAWADEPRWVSRVFLVWLSVFNLFVVSVFWSYLADLFTSEQGKDDAFDAIGFARKIGGKREKTTPQSFDFAAERLGRFVVFRVSMTTLFRPESLESRQRQWLGGIRLMRPLSLQLMEGTWMAKLDRAQVESVAAFATYPIVSLLSVVHALKANLSALAGDDDHGLLQRGFIVYDALFAWLRFAAEERHNWPAKAA